jgi:hypothetical protein
VALDPAARVALAAPVRRRPAAAWYAFLTLTAALLLLGWRARRPELAPPGAFNLRQVAIVAASGAAVLMLAAAAVVDLQGRPDFLIAGNGSWPRCCAGPRTAPAA